MGRPFPGAWEVQRAWVDLCACEVESVWHIQCIVSSVWHLQSRSHVPVCAVYRSIWHMQSPRGGTTSLYVLYMAVYGICSPPEQAPHPCMCCIWQYMAYTVTQNRCHIPVWAVCGSIWHMQSPRAGPTSLYLLYMAVYDIYSPPEQGPHPCMCCILQCMAYTVP